MSPGPGSSSWTVNVTIPALGSHSVAVRATDNAGNVSPVQTIAFLAVDNTPPVLDITTGPPRSETITGTGDQVLVDFAGFASDVHSGVQFVRWSFDGRALHLSWPGCGDLNPIDCRFIRTIYEAHPWVKVG